MSRSSDSPGSILAVRWLFAAVVAASLFLVPGCGGCGGCRQPITPSEDDIEKQRAEIQKKLKEKEKKPDFQTGYDLVAQPYDPSLERLTEIKKKEKDKETRSADTEMRMCWCKPGHWTAVTLPAKANNDHFNGDLEIATTNSGGTIGGLPGMAYEFSTRTQAPLPKGQLKLLNSLVFFPSIGREDRHRFAISDHLTGRNVIDEFTGVRRMPPYQYHFVVVARYPERYSFLKQLDSFKDPLNLSGTTASGAFYQVLLLPGDRPSTLPRHGGLYWTSIAGLLWDEADPTMLLPEQQAALLDWLHWGGQLIISGPDTLDTLKTSFLGPYLPATSAANRKLAAADVKPLSDGWTPKMKPPRTLAPVQPWPGVKLERHPEARFLPKTGELLAERRIGRGRIVVSAFPLCQRDVVNWPGMDGLVNACLLGRPQRKFRRAFSDLSGVQVLWNDSSEPRPAPDPVTMTTPYGQRVVNPGSDLTIERDPHQYDPRRTCHLWYFSRDAGRTSDVPLGAQPAVQPLPGGFMANQPAVQTPADPWFLMDSDDRWAGCGLGGWCDFNPVAGAARDTLQNAAKVEIPDASFVLWVVGGYLLVFVPLNWFLFRLIGRVEWAWIAAPVIAIVATAVVIRMARLDIGFERSETEVAVVEVQGGYSRAHVTRYTALYTPLYTDFTVHFDDPGGQVLPFPTVDAPGKFQLTLGQRATRLKYHYSSDATLEGFSVSSNSTSFLHSEQMADLGGPIRLEETPGGALQLQNRTDYTLRGAGVVWRRQGAEGESLETAWLDTLDPGTNLLVDFRPVALDVKPAEKESKPTTLADKLTALWKTQRDRSAMTADTGGTKTGGELNLRQLLNLAQATELTPGEMRLVAWIDQPVPGQQIEPRAWRSRTASVVVAHLRPGRGPDPKPDAVPRIQVDPSAYPVLTPEGVKYSGEEKEPEKENGEKPAGKSKETKAGEKK